MSQTNPLITFIVNGSSLQLKQIQSLNKYSGNQRVYEIILFNCVKKISSTYGDDKIRVFSKNEINVTSIGKAVVVSRGDIIIFCNFDSIIKNIEVILDMIPVFISCKMSCVENKQTFLSKILGLHNISNTSFIGVNKLFLSGYDLSALDKNELLRLILIANKNNMLAYIGKDNLLSSINFFDRKVIIKRHTFLITSRLAKRLVFKSLRIFKRSLKKVYVFIHDARQNIKSLSKNKVERVNYSTDIPVFINCRDRVEPLKKLVKWLEIEGMKNIYFIDNDSTYPPLLKYYKNTQHNVIKLGRNIGQTAPWDSGTINYYSPNGPFIVTDPDILPLDESHGAIKRFTELLNKHPRYNKVGFGLKIDDLPDYYDLKNEVLDWEKQFWRKKIEPDVFIADIDTTFALYRKGTAYGISRSLRTSGNFLARHEPWYINSSSPSPEIVYYRKNADKIVGTWGVKSGDLANFYLTHTPKN